MRKITTKLQADIIKLIQTLVAKLKCSDLKELEFYDE